MSQADKDRWLATSTAAVLAQGTLLNIIGLVFLVVTILLAGIRPVLFLPALALWLAQCWYALRTGIDARLFTALAQPGADLAGMDEALRDLALMPAKRQTGDLADRARRAISLLRRQGLCLVAQLVLLLVIMGVGLWPS